MRTIAEIENYLGRVIAAPANANRSSLIQCGEEILTRWISARGQVATQEHYEGFRLLALHRQGARGDPSFNACRETCRELAYHYNLLAGSHLDDSERLAVLHMMALIANHLVLFVGGKMQQAALGEFCCSAQPLRGSENEITE